MAHYDLNRAGHKNIQFAFRYEVVFPPNSTLGLNDQLSVSCTSAQIPFATGTATKWYMPMGMINHQAGRREVQPVKFEFVVSSDNGDDLQNVYNLLSIWCNTTYNLNTGVSKGKGVYTAEGIQIRVKKHDNTVNRTFELVNAFPTDVEFGTVASETNEILKVSMTLVYDNFIVSDANNVPIKGSL